jgi:esterase/lipase
MKLISQIIWIILFTAFNYAQSAADIKIVDSSISLSGKLYLSEEPGVRPTVVLLQGFPGNETDVLGIGKKLSEAGINALTFNYSGTFKSGGLVSFENNQEDIRVVFKFLLKTESIKKYRIDTAKIYLGGWCHGGGMTLAYAAMHPEITVVFSVAGNDFGEFLREYSQYPEMQKIIDKAFYNMTTKMNIRFEKGALPKEMVKAEIENMNPIFDIKKNAPLLADKNLLLIGGWNDS